MQHISDINHKKQTPTTQVSPRIDADQMCTKCDGFGWVKPDLYPHQPGFGRAVACDCRLKSNVQRYLSWSGLTPSERNMNINYGPTVENYPDAIEAMRGVIERPTGWTIVYGSFGTGKSGLLRATVASCCRAGIRARYINAADLLAEIKATFDDETLRAVDVIERYKNCRVLAIDEIDKVQATGWATETLMRIYDERYRLRDTTATLFATNMMPEQRGGRYVLMANSNPALGYLDDRLRDANMVMMDGASIRGAA